MGRCAICDDTVPDHDLIGHLRVNHPDVYEPVERWPDGEPVVVDTTLEAPDFG